MILETTNPAQLVLQVAAQNVDGTPKTALSSASVRVYHVAGGVEVVDLGAVPLLQVGSTNVWRYVWTPGSLAVGHYFVEYTLVDTDGAMFVGLEDVDVRDIARQVDLEFIRKIEQGRWRIVNEQMVFYDSDGLSPILTFDLKDINGLPSNVNIFERKPV